MKLLFWIVVLPLLLLAAFFAISNRETVTIALWPFLDGVTAPLFLALTVALYLGFVLGALVMWWQGAGARARARREARRAEMLEREKASLEARLAIHEGRHAEQFPVRQPPAGTPTALPSQ